MTLSECIRKYLDEHDGMSLRKFAALAGTSHVYMANIVNEKTSRGNNPTPSITVYKGIAHAMGIDVGTLFDMVDDSVQWSGHKKITATLSDGVKKEDVIVLSDLSEKQQRLIRGILKLSDREASALLPITEELLSDQQIPGDQ